jgi:hypothetical protein
LFFFGEDDDEEEKLFIIEKDTYFLFFIQRSEKALFVLQLNYDKNSRRLLLSFSLSLFMIIIEFILRLIFRFSKHTTTKPSTSTPLVVVLLVVFHLEDAGEENGFD